MTDVLVRLERLDGTHAGDAAYASRAVIRRGGGADRMQVADTYAPRHRARPHGRGSSLVRPRDAPVVTGWKRIVATMTAFTATQSLTLAAATLGWVQVPKRRSRHALL